MDFVIMTYNPSKRFQWTIHRKGCSDINQELKGVRTDSGFPALSPENISADSVVQAINKYLEDNEYNDRGWNQSHFKINPCCK